MNQNDNPSPPNNNDNSEHGEHSDHGEDNGEPLPRRKSRDSPQPPRKKFKITHVGLKTADATFSGNASIDVASASTSNFPFDKVQELQPDRAISFETVGLKASGHANFVGNTSIRVGFNQPLPQPAAAAPAAAGASEDSPPVSSPPPPPQNAENRNEDPLLWMMADRVEEMINLAELVQRDNPDDESIYEN